MTCEETGKLIYKSIRAAKLARRSIENGGHAGSRRERLHAYRCGGHFHLGHGAKLKKAAVKSRG